MPTGVPNVPHVPRYDPKEVAGQLAEKILTGKGAGITGLAKVPASREDRRIFQRIAGTSVEEFNAMLSQELGGISTEVLAVIKQKLANDEFKTSELAFLFSVMHDKRLSMDGRAQVTNASINVQINQYGSAVSKADLISMLEGRGPVTDLAEPEQKAG